MKLTWLSDYSQRPADGDYQTGFGRVSTKILEYLHSKGHELHEIGVGYAGQMTKRPPWQVYSPTAYGRPEGQDCAPLIAMVSGSNALVLFMDIPDWYYLGDPLNYRDRRHNQPINQHMTSLIESREWKALALTVIDGCGPLDTLPKDWERGIQGVDGIAVASRWAQYLIEKNYGVKAAYHPHGIDLSFFRQYSKEEARRRFNIPQDKYLVLCAAVNRHRKMIPASFEAVSKFAQITGRKDIAFWLHSHPAPNNIGHDFAELAHAYKLKENEIFTVFTPRLPEAAIPWMYATADVVLHLSGGEGFGCVVAEAEACRVPVLVTNYSGQAELVPSEFQKIPVKALIPFPSNNISWAWPDTDVAAERMAQLASDKGLATMIRRQGFEHIRGYEWQNLLPSFEAWLQERVDDITEQPVKLVDA